MRKLPSGMQEHLDTGTTTLCWCWKIIRNDNLVLGFTDHDRDIAFNGITYVASTGFSASELNSSIGLSVNNMDVEGVLRSDSLNEDDLQSGLYDNASIEIYRVNWSNAVQHLLMRTGSIGEVKRSDNSFTAEIRSLAHTLQQPKGRLYQYSCDASLGDLRCNIDLTSPDFKGAGVVDDVINERSFTVSGLESFVSEHFTSGIVTWPSGVKQDVKFHTALNGIVTIELWQTPVQAVLQGAAFEITAGCDKQFETCLNKFNNVYNFRGCPHMPGNDFTLSYPNIDEGVNDGGSLQS